MWTRVVFIFFFCHLTSLRPLPFLSASLFSSSSSMSIFFPKIYIFFVFGSKTHSTFLSSELFPSPCLTHLIDPSLDRSSCTHQFIPLLSYTSNSVSLNPYHQWPYSTICDHVALTSTCCKCQNTYLNIIITKIVFYICLFFSSSLSLSEHPRLLCS